MIKKLTYVAGIVSVAGFVSACATHHHYYAENEPCSTKQTAYQSTTTEASGAEAMPAATAATGNEVAIPLYEERVNVGKTEVPGQVQIRKFTTTETVSVPVELRHEHVVVERMPAGANAPASSQWSGQAFQDKAITIQTQDEQPLVQKQTVQTGQVVARKDSETQRINVQQQVRKEDVAIDKGNNPNVDVRGQFNEPAGAQPQQQQSQPLQTPRDQDDNK